MSMTVTVMVFPVRVLVMGVVSFFMAMSVVMFFVAMDGFVMMLSMEMAVDVFVEILFFMGVAVDVLVEMLFFVAVFVELLLMGVAVDGAAASEMIDQKPCA